MDEKVGMKAVHMRNKDSAVMAAIVARRDSMGIGAIKAASDARDKMVMDAGWADYTTAHVMNSDNFYCKEVFNAINKGDFDKRCFAGNSGWIRFKNPYVDAYDMAFIAGASYNDAMAIGYQAFADFYGVDAPFWAWWN